MSTSPPDIASLTLASHPRLHEAYDYDGSSSRTPFHFATSQGLQQTPYNPLSSIAPKNKSIRTPLPTVCFLSFDLDRSYLVFSNGLRPPPPPTLVLSPLTTTPIFLPQAVLLL